jgi:hypothetical protein
MAYLDQEEMKLIDAAFKSIADFIEDDLSALQTDKVKFYLAVKLAGATCEAKRELPKQIEKSFYKAWEKAYDYVLWGK